VLGDARAHVLELEPEARARDVLPLERDADAPFDRHEHPLQRQAALVHHLGLVRTRRDLGVDDDTCVVAAVRLEDEQALEDADRELDLSDPVDSFNRIRALSPHIGARGELHGRRVTIWRARLDGGELTPVEVQPEGGKRMPYEAWLRGLR
jgi:hypothetical protein